MFLADLLDFKWKYLYSKILNKLNSYKIANHDFLFVVHFESREWILGSKARRLQANSKLPGQVIYSDKFKNLPEAEGYFFLHQKYFARSMRYNPHLFRRKLIVMYTHTEYNKWYSQRHFAYILKYASCIICLNSGVKKELIDMGIPSEKIFMFHLASDPEMFKAKQRDGNGAVGFSMAFGPRKNPEVVVSLIKLMPHRKFILIGPRWQQYLEENNVINLPNFTYYDSIDYEKYPEIYHQMDVLVSPSTLEGGPVPILEAMLSNVVPVASRTGFCPDIIKNGENGFLFNTNASASEIAELIEQAYILKSNVREGIDAHSWVNYGKKINELFCSIKLPAAN